MCVVAVAAVGVGRAGGCGRGASDCRFSGRGGGQAGHMYMCVVAVTAVGVGRAGGGERAIADLVVRRRPGEAHVYVRGCCDCGRGGTGGVRGAGGERLQI